MKRLFSTPAWALLPLLTFFVALGMTGCGTTDTENLSARPWNSPQGWETGAIPSSMNQGR